MDEIGTGQNLLRMFLSYSTLDKYLAGEVKKHFKRAGVGVFLAHEDIEPSNEWIIEIRSELKNCNVFVPLITEHFRSSQWTDQEAGFAISRSKLAKNGCLIVPLVFAPEKSPHGFLQVFQALPPISTGGLPVALGRVISIICKKFGLPDLARERGRAIEDFCNSKTFASAKQNVDKLLTLEPFFLPELTRLAEASVTNNQIYLPGELKSTVKRLLRACMDKLDPQLKTQVEQRFP